MSYILQVLKKIIAGPLERFPSMDTMTDEERAIGILSNIQVPLSSRILRSTLDLKPCESFGSFQPHDTDLKKAKETPALFVFRGVQSIQEKMAWTDLTFFERSQILFYAKATQCLLKEYKSDFNQGWKKKDDSVQSGYHIINNYLENVVKFLGAFPSSELKGRSLEAFSLAKVETRHRDVLYFYGEDKGKLAFGKYDHSSGHYEDLVGELGEDLARTVVKELAPDWTDSAISDEHFLSKFKGYLKGFVSTSSLAQLKQYCQIIEAAQQPKPKKPIMVDQATQTESIYPMEVEIIAKPAKPLSSWSRIPALSVGQQLEPWTQEQRGFPIFQPDVSPGSVFSFIWHLPSGQYTGLLAQVSDVQGDFLRVNYEASLLLLSSKSSSTPGTTLIKGSPLGIQEEVVRGTVEMSPRKIKSFVDQLGQITSEQLAGFVQQMVVINRLMHRPGEASSTSLIEAPEARPELLDDEPKYTLAPAPPLPTGSAFREEPATPTISTELDSRPDSVTPPPEAYGLQEVKDLDYFIQQLKERKGDDVISGELVDLTEAERLDLSQELEARIAAAERAYAEQTTESACMDVLRERNTLSLRQLSFLLSVAKDEASEPLAHQAKAEGDIVRLDVVTDEELDDVDSTDDDSRTPSESDDESSGIGDDSRLSDSSVDDDRVIGQVERFVEDSADTDVIDNLKTFFNIKDDGYSQKIIKSETKLSMVDQGRQLVYLEERDAEGSLKAIYTRGIGKQRALGWLSPASERVKSRLERTEQVTKIAFGDDGELKIERASWQAKVAELANSTESLFTGTYIKPEYELQVRKFLSRFMKKHFTRKYSVVKKDYKDLVMGKTGAERLPDEQGRVLSTLFLGIIFDSLSRVQTKQRGKSPGRSPFWRRRHSSDSDT